MKKIALYLFALLAIAACGDDDDNNETPVPTPDENAPVVVDKAPAWSVTLQLPETGTAGKPDWQWNESRFFQYEENMTAIVHMGDVMQFLSPDDRMAALVGGQVREVAEPSSFMNDDILDCFMLLIPFDGGDDKVELQYYSARANRTYTMQNAFSVSDDRKGADEEFLFMLFPFTNHVFNIAPTSPFTYTADDEMAVFVGTTCCGTAQGIEYDGAVRWYLRFFPELAGGAKTVKLRYYSAGKKTIYSKDITIPEDWATLTLEF